VISVLEILFCYISTQLVKIKKRERERERDVNLGQSSAQQITVHKVTYFTSCSHKYGTN